MLLVVVEAGTIARPGPVSLEIYVETRWAMEKGPWLLRVYLGGGFKYFLFLPLPGEDLWPIFFKGVETTN